LDEEPPLALLALLLRPFDLLRLDPYFFVFDLDGIFDVVKYVSISLGEASNTGNSISPVSYTHLRAHET
jgi:hypothetical protein